MINTHFGRNDVTSKIRFVQYSLPDLEIMRNYFRLNETPLKVVWLRLECTISLFCFDIVSYSFNLKVCHNIVWIPKSTCLYCDTSQFSNNAIFCRYSLLLLLLNVFMGKTFRIPSSSHSFAKASNEKHETNLMFSCKRMNYELLVQSK